MTKKIMISVSDDIKAMIDEYNKRHPFEKLHISEIASKAIYEKITGRPVKALGVVLESLTKNEPKLEPVNSEKYLITESKLESVDSEKPIVICPICGKDFLQTKPTRQYCCKNCATTASKRRNKASI